MALHRLTHITIGVPNLDEVSKYYQEFGLTESAPGRLATLDGGDQLHLEEAPHRCLKEIGFGVDDASDLERIASRLSDMDVASSIEAEVLRSADPSSGVGVSVAVAAPIVSSPADKIEFNAPGRNARENARSPALSLVGQPVRPRKLAHLVLGSTDFEASTRFFVDGIGMKITDKISVGSFMRCSTDHHNVLVQAAPCTFLHHVAWEVNDTDDILRGGAHMLSQFPDCHMWGMGRHYLGSNMFWYLKDPAGNFAEYTCDVDLITDETAWQPKDMGMEPEALSAWGPPPPGPFLFPEDLPELIEAASA